MEVDFVPAGQATAQVPSHGRLPQRAPWYSIPLRQLSQVNNELWLLLSIFAVAVLLNTALDARHMLLGLYTLPTLFSAYVYGRRHATLTALGSVLVVSLITYFNPTLFGHKSVSLPIADMWFEIIVWGGILLVNGYAMGTLYEHKEKSMEELRSTYHGVLIILSQFISKDKIGRAHV